MSMKVSTKIEIQGVCVFPQVSFQDQRSTNSSSAPLYKCLISTSHSLSLTSGRSVRSAVHLLHDSAPSHTINIHHTPLQLSQQHEEGEKEGAKEANMVCNTQEQAGRVTDYRLNPACSSPLAN